MAIAFVSYILRVLADTTCSSWSTVCRQSSSLFAHIFAVVVCFMLILAATKAKQIKEWLDRFQAAFGALSDGGAGGGGGRKQKGD
jgi:hypothetical protein